MRKALNENPVVQVILVGVLVIIVAVLFMTRLAGQDSEAPPATTETTAPATSTATPAPNAEPAPSAEGTAGTATAPAASGGAKFAAGPGLPKPVANAWQKGDTVVLLVVKKGGIDDALVALSIGAAKSSPGTSLFVVETKDVADYSRIAGGVDLDRAPALVVVEPKRVTDGGLPAATVRYGFRGPQSIAQAVRDANYGGRDDLPYYPQ